MYIANLQNNPSVLHFAQFSVAQPFWKWSRKLGKMEKLMNEQIKATGQRKQAKISTAELCKDNIRL